MTEWAQCGHLADWQDCLHHGLHSLHVLLSTGGVGGKAVGWLPCISARGTLMPLTSLLLLVDGKRSPCMAVLHGTHHKADPGFSFPRLS